MLRGRDLPREGTKSILSSEIKPPLIPVFSDYIGENVGGLKSRFPESAKKFEKKSHTYIDLTPCMGDFSNFVAYIRIYQLKNTISKTFLTHFVQSYCWAAHSVGEILA